MFCINCTSKITLTKIFKLGIIISQKIENLIYEDIYAEGYDGVIT